MAGVDHRPGVAALDGVLRRYEWGSTTAIQQLLGVEPDGRPAAELWFGAHPDDPSSVIGTGVTLADLITADPVGALGADVAARFGPQLPFLVKLLAADKALSVQVHPTLALARAGWAAEEAAGEHLNYRDANHKPELICALRPFEALCGFRPVAGTLALLAELDVPELDFLAAALRGPDPLRSAFGAVLAYADPGGLVAAVAARIGAPDDRSGPRRAFALAAEDFPGDIGAVITLLLNPVRLAPGEALFLGAGNVHCYLRGLGVEIMANSDNVLRCGLTPKHVDVPEVMRVTEFAERPDPLVAADEVAPGRFAYPVPVPDFALERVHLDGRPGADADRWCSGPRIVLCVDGGVELGPDGQRTVLGPGQAAFVAASAAGTVLHGSGTAFVATVG